MSMWGLRSVCRTQFDSRAIYSRFEYSVYWSWECSLKSPQQTLNDAKQYLINREKRKTVNLTLLHRVFKTTIKLGKTHTPKSMSPHMDICCPMLLKLRYQYITTLWWIDTIVDLFGTINNADD